MSLNLKLIIIDRESNNKVKITGRCANNCS